MILNLILIIIFRIGIIDVIIFDKNNKIKTNYISPRFKIENNINQLLYHSIS